MKIFVTVLSEALVCSLSFRAKSRIGHLIDKNLFLSNCVSGVSITRKEKIKISVLLSPVVNLFVYTINRIKHWGRRSMRKGIKRTLPFLS